MKIEFWIDVTSPYCYIAFETLQTVASQIEKNSLEIQYRCYQLDPTIPKKIQKVSLAEYYAHALDISVKEANRELQDIALKGKAQGLQIDFDTVKLCNSGKALQLIKLAEKENKASELLKVFFHSYFALGKDLGDSDTLSFLANKVGLNKDGIQKVIDQNSFKAELEKDQILGEELGLEAIPFLVIDREIAFTGIQTPKTILDALKGNL